MKYYAVKEGRTPGIYHSWEDCKTQVMGYKGAIYKKFSSQEEALAFIGGDRVGSGKSGGNKGEDLNRLGEGEMVAYVDGSYLAGKKRAGYGVVLFSNRGKETFCGPVSGSDTKSRNVVGEVMAAKVAMKEARQRGARSLTIHYDYAGIRHWAMGEWKANLPLTQEYRAYAQKMGEDLVLSFVKEEAHTGVEYNEEADLLAKKGANMEINS